MKTLTEFSQVALRRAADAHKAAVAAGLEGDALAEALQTQLGIPAERVPRVIEAVEIVGDAIETLRLVRVFQGEAGPQGAISKGEFHYVVNRAPTPKSGAAPARSNDRPGRDKGKSGDKRGGGGGGGGGDRPRAEKPRGLGALKAGGSKDTGPSERVNFAEIPRAGMGWQWTRAPRDPNDTRPDRPRKGPPGRRPDGRGPGRPGGGGAGGPGGGPRGPRPQAAAPVAPAAAAAPSAPPATTPSAE
ncbi:MAG: hypothetical protein IPL79_03810 [Myxococcales bacterium]|nr:hypothetical protein [Myxococcales bacterium]